MLTKVTTININYHLRANNRIVLTMNIHTVRCTYYNTFMEVGYRYHNRIYYITQLPLNIRVVVCVCCRTLTLSLHRLGCLADSARILRKIFAVIVILNDFKPPLHCWDVLVERLVSMPDKSTLTRLRSVCRTYFIDVNLTTSNNTVGCLYFTFCFSSR